MIFKLNKFVLLTICPLLEVWMKIVVLIQNLAIWFIQLLMNKFKRFLINYKSRLQKTNKII